MDLLDPGDIWMLMVSKKQRYLQFTAISMYDLLTAALSVVVWFRILAKEVQGMMDYNWHEMTILIHQPKGGFVTVICCDMPHESMSNYSSAEKPPSNFLAELRDELDSLQEDFMPDWRFMQAAILRRAIAILDRAIWTNSKAVRVLEKVRHYVFTRMKQFLPGTYTYHI